MPNFLDFDRENPDNAFRPLTPDEQPPPEGSQLARHPYVRLLKRQIEGLGDQIKKLSDMQREMMNRSLLVGRNLEPLNPAPAGPIYPANGLPTIVHVDSLRMMYNRVMGTDHPTIRILVGGADAAPIHAHQVEIDKAEVRPLPTALPKRSGAVVVIFTHKPVVVMR